MLARKSNRSGRTLAIWQALASSLIALTLAQIYCAAEDAFDLPRLTAKLKPSVVAVLNLDEKGELASSGSGFFITATGNVVTNLHVVRGAVAMRIRDAAGREYPVTGILAADEPGDVVLLGIDAPSGERFPALALAAALPAQGSHIGVLGSPLGLECSVSEGIISAVRDRPGRGKVLQITAPISHGSSGSPVFNARGEVVGIATYCLVDGQALNFAVSALRVARLTPGEPCPFAVYPEATPDVTRLMNEGGVLADKGAWAQALVRFQKITLLSPKIAWVWFASGSCENALGHYGEAERAFRTGMALYANDADAHYCLGNALAGLGRPQEAIAEYREAIRLDPLFAAAHNDLGLALVDIRRFQEAAAEYREAIRLAPRNSPAHSNLGIAFTCLGRRQEAIAEFREAIRLDPRIAAVHASFGIVLSEVGRNEEAIDECREAVRLDPRLAVAHKGLGDALAGLKHLPEAVSEYREAVRLAPHDAGMHFCLGALLGVLGRNQEAIWELCEAVRLDPRNSYGHAVLGLCYLADGRRAEAVQEYTILKDLDAALAQKLSDALYPK